MAKNTVIRKTLTSLAEPWCDKELNQSVDIEDIEAFLKVSLGPKLVIQSFHKLKTPMGTIILGICGQKRL